MRAKQLANFAAAKSGHTQVVLASIYDDGVVLYLWLSGETQERLATTIKWPDMEKARSDNDEVGVIILMTDEAESMMVTLKRSLKKCGIKEPLSFVDCKMMDDHLIGLYVKRIS